MATPGRTILRKHSIQQQRVGYVFLISYRYGTHEVYFSSYTQRACALTESQSHQRVFVTDNRFNEAKAYYHSLLSELWNEPDCHFPGRSPIKPFNGDGPWARQLPAKKRPRTVTVMSMVLETGPKSARNAVFCCCLDAEAIRKSVGSAKGLPKNMIPTGVLPEWPRQAPTITAVDRGLYQTMSGETRRDGQCGKPCVPLAPDGIGPAQRWLDGRTKI